MAVTATKANQAHKLSVADGATSNPFYISDQSNVVSVTVIPTGTAKCQFSTSTNADIVADTATWIDWASGDVTVVTNDVYDGPISAVRLVSVSGAATMEIVT